MKGFCKQFFCGVLALATFMLSIASYAGPGSPFDKLVFFGDSLTDNGNLYTRDLGYMPKSPPYYEGRFSNGLVWSEYAAKYYYDKNYVSSTNYAFGGETAVLHNPFNHYLPYYVSESYESYRAHTLFSDRKNTLLIIWIGANDYLNGSKDDEESKKQGKDVRGQTPDAKDVQELSEKVVANIKANIQSLIGLGVENILVVNLPDFSKIPYALGSTADIAGNLKALTIAHNQKLVQAVAELQNSNKAENIQLYDVATMFDSLLSNPPAYNGKFQVNITNTTDACWTGSYTKNNALRKAAGVNGNAPGDLNQVNVNEIAQDYMTYLNAHKKLSAAKGQNENTIDVQGFANFVANSPALSETYKTEKAAAAGLKPCKNPENYVFWDHVHPTTVIHKALAQDMIKFIDANFKTLG